MVEARDEAKGGARSESKGEARGEAKGEVRGEAKDARMCGDACGKGSGWAREGCWD